MIDYQTDSRIYQEGKISLKIERNDYYYILCKIIIDILLEKRSEINNF